MAKSNQNGLRHAAAEGETVYVMELLSGAVWLVV